MHFDRWKMLIPQWAGPLGAKGVWILFKNQVLFMGFFSFLQTRVIVCSDPPTQKTKQNCADHFQPSNWKIHLQKHLIRKLIRNTNDNVTVKNPRSCLSKKKIKKSSNSKLTNTFGNFNCIFPGTKTSVPGKKKKVRHQPV